MLRKIVKSSILLSVCLCIGYAKPLMECKNYQDRFSGCIKKEYYEFGGLWEEIPYKNGKINGVLRSYWESDGQLWREAPYNDGRLDGVVKEYDEQGKILPPNR